MTELSKFINLLIEFEEKVEGHLNKKYKPFIRKIINLDTLTKTVNPNKVVLTKEFIVFKLGLEAKSQKAVQISLTFLHKLFQNKFVDLNLPNYCEQYTIQQTGVKELEGVVPTKQIRTQLIQLMRHCLHFKSQETNLLVVKVLEYLITEPILDLILDSAKEYPHQSTSSLLSNFFSFRFHVYEEICSYSEKQMQSFQTLAIINEKITKEIKRAHEEHNLTFELVERYMVEYMSIIDGSGGRYGRCVMCNQPAEHYCKITKASLCGMDCKKKHIQIAQKQYKHYFQASHLWQSIHSSFQELLVFLEHNQSPLVLGVFSSLLQKPFLFMVVKQPFRSLISRHIPAVLTKILVYRHESAFQYIYILMANLTKHWLFECLSPIQYFFKQYIIRILEDKKPTFRFLNLVFKALARILEHGKVTIQLYINFDCEVNKENILQKVLFELAKIVQDRYAQSTALSKHERQSVKNHCLSLFIIMAMGLNQYRKQEIRETKTDQIIQLKQKKMSLQQFVVRFNQHWTSGLKTLFNLNLVGLDSNEEIVDILLNLKGLSKEIIFDYFSCQKGNQLYEIFLSKLATRHNNSLFISLLDLFHYIPLRTNSVCLKKFVKFFQQKLQINIQKDLQLYMNFLCGTYNQQDFKKFINVRKEYQTIPQEAEKLFVFAVETKQHLTAGNHTTYFTYCCSRDYLNVISNQIALLQIPISYLLQSDYEIERLLSLSEELVQICPHSNWLSLLIKNSALDRYPSPQFDQTKLKIVQGVINIIEKQAHFIQNWSAIIHFLAQLYNVLSAFSGRPYEGKFSLPEKMNIGIVERCLMEAGAKSDIYFGKFMLAVITIARQQLEKDQKFMTHKFFELVDANSKKFLQIVEDFMPFLLSFTKQLENSSPDICISVADMLKQSFAKLLKAPKSGNKWATGGQAEFWQLFLNLSNNKNKEVSDFVVNCITMSILHHYDLSYKSWINIFSFMKNNAKHYSHQVFTIIDKILSEKMRNCEEFYSDLVDICLELVHPEETKTSNEALRALKTVLELTSDIKFTGTENDQSEESSARHMLSNLIIRVEERLITFIFYYCHETIMDIFFRLLKVKANGKPVLSIESIGNLIQALFSKVQQFQPNNLQISQKTINYALTWSQNNKYSLIVSFYESLVINKYTPLSLSAIKCIKTYIQMVNPKSREDWLHIETSLLSISKSTRLSDQLNLKIHDKCQNYKEPVEFDDRELKVDINLFANKMVIQKSIVEMLPNHLECLEEVATLYQEITQFNDNLYLRCLLWRRGLGAQNSLHPPNLLSLQETINGKLVAIYNSSKEENIVQFAMTILEKYCQTSAKLNEIQEHLKNSVEDSTIIQVPQLLKEYLASRRVPLMRVINYFLPKFIRYCKKAQQRKQIVLNLVQCCKYVESREPFLKSIKELTKQLE